MYFYWWFDNKKFLILICKPYYSKELPILVYNATLCMTGVVFSGFSLRLGLGGFIFVVSDFLILLEIVKMNFPLRASLVGLTYVVAKYLIVTGSCDCYSRQYAKRR